jgi:exopolyphosphatase/guanosine-5'-triphosphate,3'-diphosphate pyrophosphatase
MIVAQMENGHLQIVDRLREMVQLAAGLDEKNKLSEAAQARALDCLARFGQRLRHMPSSRVRIVGTNTLREARNGQEFLRQAETVLGHSVEVVSGMEEARLIYLGVAQSIADVEGQRLVIDIGGGSTELIIGEKFEPLTLESLGMGCVSMALKYFPDGYLREADLRAAELAVSLKLEPIALAFREIGWQPVVGASGTIKAIHEVVTTEGWSLDSITMDSLHNLRHALLEEGKVTNIAKRWQLHPARAFVFTGGFTILLKLCETLAINQLQVSEGALREGLLYDLIGRIRHEDVRHRTVASLTRRYSLDNAQAERVAATAHDLLAQIGADWGLVDEEYTYMLDWAARLHEIGLAIAHSQSHKHGAYVIQHADLAGFSRSEQTILATLIRAHRRKFPSKYFAALSPDITEPVKRLSVVLRIAVVLHRSRNRQPLPTLQAKVKESCLKLLFPTGWLSAHPLTLADLAQEADYLRKAGIDLHYS